MTPKNKPIRIVYLIGQLGLGGSERQLYLLLKYIDKTRFEPHVIVFNPSEHYTLDEDLQNAGVAVHKIPTNCKSIPARSAWLYHVFRALRPHILHSWTIHDNAYAGVIGWLAGIPHRLGSVRDSINTEDFRAFPSLLRLLILRGVQSLVVNSQQIADELIAERVPAKRVFFLPNCVEMSKVANAPLPEHFPAYKRIIGMVANLRRKKNHLHFIQSLASLLPEFPELAGVMVGQPVRASDPEVPEKIQDEIQRLGVGNRIILTGFHPNPAALLPHFEIFCLPSDFEGTPNAILEAMSAELPIVATRVGGIPNAVEDGVTGILIAPGNIEALTSALRHLLNNPQTARQMGQAGREKIQREFSPQAILPLLEKYYLKIIK